MVAQLTVNQPVAGSNPARGARNSEPRGKRRGASFLCGAPRCAAPEKGGPSRGHVTAAARSGRAQAHRTGCGSQNASGAFAQLGGLSHAAAQVPCCHGGAGAPAKPQLDGHEFLRRFATAREGALNP